MSQTANPSAVPAAANPFADYYSEAELAKLLQKHPRTLIRWSQSGNFPRRIKLGRLTFYSRSSIAGFLKSMESEKPRRRRGR